MIDLTLLNKNKTNVLIIRHADRDNMDMGQIEQPLNAQGIMHAKELGYKLQGFVNYVFFSSPVDRCQQTIEYIQEGIFSEKGKIQNNLSEYLGKPGVFIVDRTNNAFHTLSCRKVVVKQIAHEKLNGIRNSAEGTKIFVDFVIAQMNRVPKGTLLVFVTHDAIIAPIIFELTGEKFGYDNWPDFSDGFIIEQNDNTTIEHIVIRKNKYYTLRKF